MRIIVCKNYEEMSVKAGEIVKDVIGRLHRPKIGLATGSTPEGLYKELIRMNKEDILNFEHAETVNLDEYVGIDENNEQSYHYYMYDKLFNHINIKDSNIHIPSCKDKSDKDALIDYDKELDYVGRRDIQILGVGNNGHIAFNEPADKLNLRTSFVDLTDETVESNSRFFEDGETVPNRAITMGIGDILNADTILMMANGEKKQDVVKEFIECKMLDTHFPISMLHVHKNVILLVDEIAYAKVGNK